jgi:hypothetical protein
METVAVRISTEDRQRLEDAAATLETMTGASVTMTDAFAFMLRTTGDDTGVAMPHELLGETWAVVLDEDQIAALDAIADRLARRKATLLGREVKPVRSDAIRFVIRSGVAGGGSVTSVCMPKEAVSK